MCYDNTGEIKTPVIYNTQSKRVYLFEGIGHELLTEFYARLQREIIASKNDELKTLQEF